MEYITLYGQFIANRMFRDGCSFEEECEYLLSKCGFVNKSFVYRLKKEAEEGD